jgi:hypothetical protein
MKIFKEYFPPGSIEPAFLNPPPPSPAIQRRNQRIVPLADGEALLLRYFRDDWIDYFRTQKKLTDEQIVTLLKDWDKSAKTVKDAKDSFGMRVQLLHVIWKDTQAAKRARACISVARARSRAKRK